QLLAGVLAVETVCGVRPRARRPVSAASCPSFSRASSWQLFSLVLVLLWLWPLPFSWEPSWPVSLRPAWEPPFSQRERVPSPALLRRGAALPLPSPPLRRQRVRRLLPAPTARCRLRNYPSRGPCHP